MINLLNLLRFSQYDIAKIDNFNLINNSPTHVIICTYHPMVLFSIPQFPSPGPSKRQTLFINSLFVNHSYMPLISEF